jgi:low affinity Fe/Cu permease
MRHAGFWLYAMHIAKHLEDFTHCFAKWAGSATGFVLAFGSILLWLAVGWYSGFSVAWEGDLTAFIGIVTFLMVFLIQRSQNKELMALQIKLNELINATQKADNYLINIEALTEKELSLVQKEHRDISKNAVDAGMKP